MQQPDIPEEQLSRILPIVNAVLSGFQTLFADLPLDAESAVIFDPAETK